MANQSRIRRRYLAATRYQMRVERLCPYTMIIAGGAVSVANGCHVLLPSLERLTVKLIGYELKRRSRQANRRVVHIIQSNPELLLINLGRKQ